MFWFRNKKIIFWYAVLTKVLYYVIVNILRTKNGSKGVFAIHDSKYNFGPVHFQVNGPANKILKLITKSQATR